MERGGALAVGVSAVALGSFIEGRPLWCGSGSWGKSGIEKLVCVKALNS